MNQLPPWPLQNFSIQPPALLYIPPHPTNHPSILLAQKSVVATRHIHWRCRLVGVSVRGLRGARQYSTRRTTERQPHFLLSAPAAAPVSLAKCTFFYTDIRILVLLIHKMWIRGQILCLYVHIFFVEIPDKIFYTCVWHISIFPDTELEDIKCLRRCTSKLKVLTLRCRMPFKNVALWDL